MSDKSFEEKLKAKTESFSPIPKAGSWEAIAAELPVERRKKKGIFILFISVLVLSSLSLLLYRMENKSIPATSLTENASYSASGNKLQKQIPVVSAESNQLPDQHSSAPMKHYLGKRAVPTTGRIHSVGNKHKRFTATEQNFFPSILAADFLKEFEKEEKLKAEEQGISKPELLSASANDSGSAVVSEPEIEKPLKPDSGFYPDDVLPLKRPRMVFAGLQFSPGFMSTKVELDAQYNGIEQYEKQYRNRKNEDKGQYSFAFSVFAGMEKNRHRVSIGLQYMQLEYKMPVININEAMIRGSVANFAKLDYNATDSFKLQSRSEGGEYIQNMYAFISIPLQYSIQCIKTSKFGLGIHSSLSANFLGKHKGVLAQNEAGIFVKSYAAPENHNSKFHLSAGFGLEAQYSFARNWGLLIRPQYQFSLAPIEKSRISTAYRFTNISCGLYYFLY